MKPDQILVNALTLHKNGRPEKALPLYREFLSAVPSHPEGNYLAAVAAHQLGMSEDAAGFYRKALEARPENADAAAGLGTVCLSLGRAAEAEEAFRRGAKHNPADAEIWCGLGMALNELGRSKEAAEMHEQALSLNPGLADALMGLGVACLSLGRAAEAERYCRRALERVPQSADAHNCLGVALKAQARLGEAEAEFRTALELEPDFVQAWDNLGNALREMGRTDEAAQCYDRVLALAAEPGTAVKRATLLPVVMESAAGITRDRERMAREIRGLREKGIRLEDPYREVGYTNFFLAYHGLDDRELQEQMAALYLEACPELGWAAPHVGREREGGSRDERIRLGVVSAFLHLHTIGKLNQGIIENLPKDRFHITVYRLPGRDDVISRAIEAAADETVHLPDDLFRAREAVAAGEPDVLFYPDIGMHALTYFMAFARLAPVQCTTWGHPVTTGIPNMDWFLSSRHLETEGSQACYSERLHAISRVNTYYYRPAEAPVRTRTDYGLPEDRRLYVCPQSLFKFHPDFFAALGEILRRDGQGVIACIAEDDPVWGRLLTERVAAHCPDAETRLVFLPRMPMQEFMALLPLADCLLDTFHFGGGNTTLEAFAQGAPVVTLPSGYLRGRITHAFYKQMGMHDLIAGTPEEYVELALKLAQDREFHAGMVRKVRERAGVLFEDRAVIDGMAEFFEKAWEEASGGRGA